MVVGQEHRKQDAVLVTGPRIRCERIHGPQDGQRALLVEPESYRDVDVSESSVPAMTAAVSALTTTSSSSSYTTSLHSNPIRRLWESSFLGGPSRPPEEQELEELALSGAHHQRRSMRQRQPNGVDNRRHARSHELAFDHDDSDDDDIDDDEYMYGEDLQQHYFNDHRSMIVGKTNATSSKRNNNKQHRGRPCSYLLGEAYYSDHDRDGEEARRRTDEASLFWFTYRCDFPCIAPYNITSDAGWGCMLRALQMLMAQSLRIHYKGRQWRPPGMTTAQTSTTTTTSHASRQDPFVRAILMWFADFPSTTESLYSLHNMVAAGVAKYDKLPGEWYEPGTACYVLRDLVEMHLQQQQQQQQHTKKMFRVHVASGGTVYRDEIDQLVAREALEARARYQQTCQENNALAHPLDLTSWEEEEEEVAEGTTSAAGGAATLISKRSSVDLNHHLPWDTALLLLIPLRLGLKSFHTDYCQILAHTFSLPQSVGILGGRPRGARWFYGAHADGRRILGLDPHTVQAAPRRRRLATGRHQQFVVDMSDDYIRSVHTAHPETFALPKLDPSIALGFYCRTRADFEHVMSELQQWKQNHPGTPELFAVADCAPNYEANCLSSRVHSTTAGGKHHHVLLEESLLDDDENDSEGDDQQATNEKVNTHEDDDDEFVLL